jgi:hypothetical protein
MLMGRGFSQSARMFVRRETCLKSAAENCDWRSFSRESTVSAEMCRSASHRQRQAVSVTRACVADARCGCTCVLVGVCGLCPTRMHATDNASAFRRRPRVLSARLNVLNVGRMRDIRIACDRGTDMSPLRSDVKE